MLLRLLPCTAVFVSLVFSMPFVARAEPATDIDALAEQLADLYDRVGTESCTRLDSNLDDIESNRSLSCRSGHGKQVLFEIPISHLSGLRFVHGGWNGLIDTQRSRDSSFWKFEKLRDLYAAGAAVKMSEVREADRRVAGVLLKREDQRKRRLTSPVLPAQPGKDLPLAEEIFRLPFTEQLLLIERR